MVDPSILDLTETSINARRTGVCVCVCISVDHTSCIQNQTFSLTAPPFLFHYYAALLPRRGPHIASHSVCPSVRLSIRPSRYRASRRAT